MRIIEIHHAPVEVDRTPTLKLGQLTSHGDLGQFTSHRDWGELTSHRKLGQFTSQGELGSVNLRPAESWVPKLYKSYQEIDP